LAFDSSGNLWVVDKGNRRVLQFKPPFTNGMSASLVIDQPNLTSDPLAQLRFPEFIAFDTTGNLWVTDDERVVEFKAPFTSSMAASLVIGQSFFAGPGTAGGTPTGIAFDSTGTLWIGDSTHNRVLGFKPPFATGMAASVVLGQPDFTSNNPTSTRSGFSNPFGIGFDSQGNLLVADDYNGRTMIFKPPFSNNQNAAVVLGQPDFTTVTPSTTTKGEAYPTSVRALHYK
jgi:sugar lactone lactonase YvrE